MTAFDVYLLHEHKHGSYICLESYQVEASDERLAKRLEQTALERVKSHREFKRVKPLGTAKFEIYQCSDPLQGESSSEKETQAVDVANCGDLKSYQRFCFLGEDDSPEDKMSSELIIVFRNLRFDFVIFEYRSGSYDDFGSGHMMAFPGDSARKIHDAARSNILDLLCGEDPEFTYTIVSLSVHEVKVQYETDYRKALDGELQPHLLKRGISVIRRAEDNVRDLETSNLIVLFTATHPLRIPYVLFSRESGSYKLSHDGYIRASSGDTVAVIQNTIHERITVVPTYSEGRIKYFFRVYEPKEAFQLAYNKQPNEMRDLMLEDETLS